MNVSCPHGCFLSWVFQVWKFLILKRYQGNSGNYSRKCCVCACVLVPKIAIQPLCPLQIPDFTKRITGLILLCHTCIRVYTIHPLISHCSLASQFLNYTPEFFSKPFPFVIVFMTMKCLRLKTVLQVCDLASFFVCCLFFTCYKKLLETCHDRHFPCMGGHCCI